MGSILLYRQVRKLRKETRFMQATLSSILTDISALNDEVQAIRTFIAANPVSPGAIQQVSDNLATAKGNLDGLKNQLGMEV